VKSGAYPNHTMAHEWARSIASHLKEAGHGMHLSGKQHIQPESVFAFELSGGNNPDAGAYPAESLKLPPVMADRKDVSGCLHFVSAPRQPASGTAGPGVVLRSRRITGDDGGLEGELRREVTARDAGLPVAARCCLGGARFDLSATRTPCYARDGLCFHLQGRAQTLKTTTGTRPCPSTGAWSMST
jgi:hypothetical protein